MYRLRIHNLIIFLQMGLFSHFIANIVKGEWRIKQVYSFIIPSHILFSRFTANITTNAQMFCKRMGKNLFLHAMSAAKLR